MAVQIDVARSELAFEAGFPSAEFSLLQGSSLLHHLYARLLPHGLKLADLRIERGAGNVGDYHVLCYLFDYLMTIRVRIERIEVQCSSLPNAEQLGKYQAAIVDLLQAVKDFKKDLSFRAFAVASTVHARLQGVSVRDYLASFAPTLPKGLGTPTGNGAAFYFGPEGDRILSSITLDTSALVSDALFVRIHAVWDASKISPETLAGGVAEGFVRQALDTLGLHTA